MGNEAIGEVTVAIRNLLKQGLGNDYEVSLYSPWENFGNDKGVNLFLYRIKENAQWKNMDWPADRKNPKGIPRSPLSLELFYLLTPYAKKETPPTADEATALRVLGAAMQILHENSVLNDVHNSFFDADNNANFSESLRDSYEKIKIYLDPINMEEMSKIWSMGEEAYRLSVSYRVSLVQIPPSVPAKVVAAPVQETGLEVTTYALPEITELSPTEGPVGTELTITGVNLYLKGFRTMVRFGDNSITDFQSITEGKIVITVPDNIKKGPDQKITVNVDNRESKPQVFHVTPWISSIKPQRGAVDATDTHSAPIKVHGYDLQGTAVMSIGGVAINPADITVVDDKLIRSYVPNILGNGQHIIDLSINGDPTNKRTFEVTSLIESITPFQGYPGDSININGQRLDGTKIRISIGSSVITPQSNANPTQISFDVPKTLKPGNYTVKISVDDYESNGKTFEVIE
jgi:hypothetical protein